jgi:CheY-specific phosphatase CheX
MANEAVRIPIEAVDNTRAAFNSVNANLDKTAKNAKVVTGSFGRFRGASQQLGFQIQDVAVQLKSGTDASVVFAQQGSQIASIFGPAGAVVGALIAVGAAVAGPFISSILGGTNALKDMEKAADDVVGGLAGLTATQFARALASNAKAVEDAQRAIQEANEKVAASEQRIAELRASQFADLRSYKQGIEDETAVIQEQNRIIESSTIVIELAAKAKKDFNEAQDAAKIREVNEALREQKRLTKEMADAEKEAGSRLLGINQFKIDASIKERREKKQNKEDTISFLDDQLAASAQNSRKMFAVNKAFRIAQATMQTYEAATKALAAFPPPFGQLAAVATVGFGLGQVAAIKSQSFEGGGFTGRGARAGGLDGKGGRMAMIHPNETVIDHTKGGAGGITVINNVDARGSGADVDQKIKSAMAQTSQQTIMTIRDLMRRRRFV